MHRVVALALPDVVAFDLSVPAQVFGRYEGPYAFEACARRAGRVPTTTGFAVDVARGLEALADADTVIVPGFDPPSWVTSATSTSSRARPMSLSTSQGASASSSSKPS